MQNEKERISKLIEARNMIEDEMKQIAHTIDPTKPWKRTIRENLNLVI